MFLFIEIFTIIVQVALVEFGGQYAKCTSLSLNQHLLCIAIGALAIPFGIHL